MKLVVVYVVSDDCTYSFTETAPVEYESAEAFAVGFEEACLKAREDAHKKFWEPFHFAGRAWDHTHFFYRGGDKKYYGPEIYELEEWFEKHKQG